MRFPVYPEYKDSGVAWLGEVPGHWEMKRLKFAAENVNSKTDAITDGADYIALENIESWTGKRLVNADAVNPESQTNCFSTGDILFGKLRPYLAKVLRAEGSGYCSTELLVLRGTQVLPEFLQYCCLSKDFIDTVDGSTYGSKMPRANWDFIGNLPQIIPPLPEQRAIAAFLDRETARIDALIAKKQRLIELMQEKRAALISHAVTQGLNPAAPRKDSGIPWLGQIPAHWGAVPLRWFVRIRSGDFIGNEQFEREMADGMEIPVIGGNGVSGYTSMQNVDGQTIVIGRVGALCGNVHLIEGQAWVTDNALVARYSKSFFPVYLVEVLRVFGLNKLANQNAQPLITGTMVKALHVPMPPLQEQQMIMTWVAEKTSHIHILQEHTMRAVKAIQEYRASLIAHAVTGKIDVRHVRSAEIPETA